MTESAKRLYLARRFRRRGNIRIGRRVKLSRVLRRVQMRVRQASVFGWAAP